MSWKFFQFKFRVQSNLLDGNFHHVITNYISKTFTLLSQDNEIVQFKVSNVFFFPYVTHLHYKKSNNVFDFVFSVDYRKLLYFLLAYVIAISFFIQYSLAFFLWLSGISCSVICLYQYYMLHSLFEQIIQNAQSKRNNEEIITPEQQLWIDNYQLCPACGTQISDYDANCKECGLFVKNVPTFSRFSFSENLEQFTIQYKITNEKD